MQADLPKPRVAIVRDVDAERVRDGPLAQVRDGVLHHGDPRAPLPRRARGRARARARPRAEPRRDGHDDRLASSRRSPPTSSSSASSSGAGATPTTRTARACSCSSSSRSLVYAVSFVLMQALSRYREFAADRAVGAHHGPAERADLGAAEDLGRHAPDPAAGPPRRRAR